MQIDRFSFRSIKISCMDSYHLQCKIDNIRGKIISVKPTTPDATDTNYWYEVYYKYSI